MKCVVILAATLAAMASRAGAAEAYDSYEAFYAAQSGTVFRDSVKFDAGAVYSYPGEAGIHTERRATLGGKAVRVDVAQDRIAINGETYRFTRATDFPGEYASEIDPASADVFLAERTNSHSAALCVEGSSNGSGESDRHKQIYLLMSPLASRSNATFLHLPSLLSSCRAVLETEDGKLAFPRNSYLFDDAQDSRIGLLVSYYTFDDRRFVPTAREIRLRFSQPDIPFRFSIQKIDR